MGGASEACQADASDVLVNLAEEWKRRFVNPPISHWMRDSPGWLRIHSLPGSKRYPESDAEYAEMVRRHNAVAQAVLQMKC